jgi:hypothetical protein
MSDPPTGNNTGGFIIIAFQLNNPGTWVFSFPVYSCIHLAPCTYLPVDKCIRGNCHIAWHISAGLGIQFVERQAEIAGQVVISKEWNDNCNAWNAYQVTNNPPRDDSGL